jgi:hypothetical protein
MRERFGASGFPMWLVSNLSPVGKGSFFYFVSHVEILLLIVAAHHHVVALSSKAYRALFVKRATFTEPTARSPNQVGLAGAKNLRGHAIGVFIVCFARRFLGTSRLKLRHSVAIVPSASATLALAVVASVRLTVSGRATEVLSSDACQAQFGELFRFWYAVFIPTTHAVIHRQHLFEMDNHALRRPGWVRLFE